MVIVRKACHCVRPARTCDKTTLSTFIRRAARYLRASNDFAGVMHRMAPNASARGTVTTRTFDLAMPTDTTCATRIEWAGERHADLVEGLLPNEAGWFIWATIVGWADLCRASERRQYLAMAKNFAELLQAREND